jgi:hypothetical protein
LNSFLRIQSVETAIGLLKNLQTSLILEETWVETKAQKLKLLPASRHDSDIDVSVILFLRYSLLSLLYFVIIIVENFMHELMNEKIYDE